MKCEDIRRHFSEYIDREAPTEIAGAIEEHVAACGECRRVLKEMQAFEAAMASVGEEELPFDFTISLRNNLNEENQRRQEKARRKRRPWMWALAACACLLLVVGVVGLGGALFAGATAGAKYATEDCAVAECDSAPMAEPMTQWAEPEALYGGYYDGAASDNGVPYDEEGLYVAEEEAPELYTADVPAAGNSRSEKGPSEEGISEELVERKIIKNYNLSLQVDDFDAAYDKIGNLAKEFGGYVVSGYNYDYENSTSRDGNISIRVDASRADEAVERISELGLVENNSFSSSDITSDYYDTQSRLEQYRAQEKRLRELYDQAETIQDLISLESELTRVISEIESMEGTLRCYDQLTALSLIDVYLHTPNNYTKTVEPTGWAGFWKDISGSFLRGVNGVLDGIAGFFVFLVRILPAILLLAVVILVLVLLIRHGKNKDKREREREKDREMDKDRDRDRDKDKEKKNSTEK